MRYHETSLAQVYVIESQVTNSDARGSFMRLFCQSTLSQLLSGKSIMQINHSLTHKTGTIRGLHFQYPPYSEIKIVRCLKGRVFDVAVDLRRDSATFLKWHAEELTPENGRMLLVPEGCAHGFQTLVADSELIYLHTASYQPQHEGGTLYNDPAINIHWPLECAQISSKDTNYSRIDHNFKGIYL